MSVEEIIKLLDDYDEKSGKLKIILWLGAGIDRNDPTNLPLGSDLTYFMLRKACVKDELAKSSKDMEKAYGSVPRLEAVIDCFHRFENAQKNKQLHRNFLNGFQSFWRAEPNAIHYWIATLLQNGANAVTTNFDNCIPKAYEKISNSKDRLVRSIYQGCPGCYKFSSESKSSHIGNIYYIHGIADDIPTLGATLTQLGPGLPKAFQHLVKTWLHDGYTFLFLGYGAVDSLDVNPFFNSIPKNKTAKGIYIEHDGNNNELSFLPISSCPENIQNLLQSFSQQIVIKCNTNIFLQKLSYGTPTELSEKLQETSSNQNTQKICVDENWEERFLNSYGQEKLSFEDRLALSVQICFILGKDAKYFLPKKWWKDFKKCKNVTDWYKNYYGAMVGKLSNNKHALRYFPPPDDADSLIKSDYFTAWHRHRKAVEVLGSLESILEQLCIIIRTSEQKVGWDISTATNRWFNYIFLKILSNPFWLPNQKKKYHQELETLYDITKLLIAHKEQLSEVYQYYIALRIQGVLLSLQGDENGVEQFIAKSISEYQAISSTSGVIVTYFLSSICNTILFCFGKRKFFSRAFRDLQQMMILIKQNKQHYYFIYFACGVLFYIWGLLFGRIICKGMNKD